MKKFVFPVLFCLSTAPVSAQTLSGQADVIDGDTIGLRGESTRIRLYGIDAPESHQTCDDAAGKRYLCGGKTAEALATLIGRNGRVTCREEEKDRYGRSVAVCEVNGVNLNAELVRQGWAVEYKQYSDGQYADEEADAQKARRGLWAGVFVKPWEWRRGERLPSEKPKVVEGTCVIKGNVSGDQRIFHVPGGRFYEKTQVDERKGGGRWFCSAEEARSAGWRPSGR